MENKPLWIVMFVIETEENSIGNTGAMPVFDDYAAARSFSKRTGDSEIIQIAGEEE
jgi:hypothetical protein